MTPRFVFLCQTIIIRKTILPFHFRQSVGFGLDSLIPVQRLEHVEKLGHIDVAVDKLDVITHTGSDEASGHGFGLPAFRDIYAEVRFSFSIIGKPLIPVTSGFGKKPFTRWNSAIIPRVNKSPGFS